MLRILNVLAIVALVGSAVYAYSIKYATLYQVERMAKLKRELQTETDNVAMLRAEWSHVANPVRIEVLADKYLGGQVMQLAQISTVAGLPDKAARGDEIGAKLADLGLSEPTNTPAAASDFSATPASPKPAAANSKPAAANSKPAPKSASAAPTPVLTSPKPAAATPKPAAATPKPAAATPKPAAATPKPAAATQDSGR